MCCAQTKQVPSRPLEKFKSLCVALAQRGEAGSASREQSCCSWCVELALPHLTACAAAAVLTAVLARAESFTLVVAGHELELSGGCSCSTSSCPSCCTTARLEGQQQPSPPRSRSPRQNDAQEAAADRRRREAWPQHEILPVARAAQTCYSGTLFSVIRSVNSVCLSCVSAFCARSGRHRRTEKQQERHGTSRLYINK